MTAEEAAKYKIPPCVSNWKNAKGYTIPLEMRLSAEGRYL
jgi:SNW domain-containing protein 1